MGLRACLALGALLAAGPSFVLAAPGSAVGAPLAQEPACLAQVRARLRGTVTATAIVGRTVRGKRIVVHRGGATLLLDHAVFEATTRAFLEEQGAGRFPEEHHLLQRFSEELTRSDEVGGDRMPEAEARRFDYRLAELLERGGFEVRGGSAGKPSANVILRLEYSHSCGPLCGSGGRVFVTDTCQRVLEVLDWIS